MTTGTIAINYLDGVTNSDLCDDLEEYGMLIVELGSRERTTQRVNEIRKELNARRAAKILEPTVVGHLTIDVDPGEFDFDVLWWQPERLDLDGVADAVRTAVTEWRAKGKPDWMPTVYEYEEVDDDE